MSAGDAEARIAYGDIERVGLLTYGGMGGAHAQCTLKVREGGTVKLRSRHFAGLGRFEDRVATYAPLVRELCRRVKAANPQAVFAAGNSGVLIVWLVVFALVLGLAALIAHDALTGEIPLLDAAFFLVPIAVITPFMLRYMRLSRPKRFDPDDPPRELFGKG